MTEGKLAEQAWEKAPAGAVIVTGAAGYIGSRFVAAVLRNTQAHVIGVDKKAAPEKHPRLRWLECDLAASSAREILRSLSPTLQEAAVFHLAGLFVKDIALSPRISGVEYDRDNLTATRHLVDAILEAAVGPRLFVFSSTACVYDGSATHPTPVELARPIVPYAESKYAAEHEVARLVGKVPHVLVLRLSRVIGLSQGGLLPQDIVRDFMERMAIASVSGRECRVGSSEEVRPYVHIDDLMEVCLQILGSYRRRGLLISNVTPRTPLRVADVAAIVAETMVKCGLATDKMDVSTLAGAKPRVPILYPAPYDEFSPRFATAQQAVRQAAIDYCKGLRRVVRQGDYLACISQMKGMQYEDSLPEA